MLALFSQGISIGFAAGVTPGPLQTFLLLQTLRRGWRHAIWIVLSPLISDGPVVALILLVLGQASAGLLRAISLIGGAFVFSIAWGVWKQLRAGGFRLDDDPAATGEVAPVESRWAALRHGVTINALGPGAWVFWGTVNGPLVVAAWRESPPSALAFLVGFYGVFLATMAAQVAVFHQARRLGPRVVTAALVIGLVAMVGFALSLWWRALT